MKKVYHLGTCSTCQSILKETGISNLAASGKFILQDIKTEKITPAQLDEMKSLSGSYESLFSRRALKYREWGLKEKKLTEDDYRNYILQEYTFLKRPVIIVDSSIFIGNDKKTTEVLMQKLI
jgi:arsenate reductase